MDTAAFSGVGGHGDHAGHQPQRRGSDFSGANYTLSGLGTLTMQQGTSGLGTSTMTVGSGTQTIATAVVDLGRKPGRTHLQHRRAGNQRQHYR